MSVFITEQYPPGDRGKIFAAQQGVNSLLAPVGLLVSIPLSALLTPSQTLALTGVMGCCAYAIPLTQRQYWSMRAEAAS